MKRELDSSALLTPWALSVAEKANSAPLCAPWDRVMLLYLTFPTLQQAQLVGGEMLDESLKIVSVIVGQRENQGAKFFDRALRPKL